MADKDRRGKRSPEEIKAVFEVRRQAKDQARKKLKDLGAPVTGRHGVRTRYPNVGGILN